MFTIHMHDDGRVQVIRQDTSAPQKVKYVSLDDLVMAFKDQATQSPILPQGVVQFWQGYDYEAFTVYRAPHKRKMTLCEEEYDMPIPGILIAARFNKNDEGLTLTDSAIFAVRGPFMGEETKLCSFPFGNVFDDNLICWGGVGINLKTSFQVGSLPDLFLGSNYNFDLEGRYVQPDNVDNDDEDDENYQGLQDFWKEMSALEKFPENRLIELCTYRNIRDYISFLN